MAEIVASSDDAIIGKDLSGTVTSWNRGAERLFGYRSRDAIGRSILFLIPRDRRQEERTILAKIAAGEHVDHYETVRRRKDGSTVQVSLTVSPIKDAGGRIIGASKIARDISDRIKAEQAIRAAHAALLESEKQILSVSEEERRRVGADLHDNLGQQLTAIELLCDSLRADLRPGRKAKSRLRQICLLLQSAVTKTRQLSRGLMPVSVDEVGLSNALRKLVLQMRRGFVDCEFVCPAEVEIGDNIVASHLFHIAQEALNNAAKHSKASKVVITLLQQNGAVLLRIEDNGRGFPRLKPAGPSVGLRIMRHRANVIGATLEAKSVRGKGVCVTCTLRDPI
jgi:PAS domain S-box-containing protein